MKTVVVVLLLLSTATAMVMADDQYLAWDIEMLASEDEYSLLLVSDEIELRNPRDRVLKRISRKRVESLDRIMRDIERAAELDTQFLIVQGDEPNASAGYRAGEAVVFVNFGMLDLLHDQADEWAALLGHEVAHLKLEHSVKNTKRRIPLKILDAVVSATTSNPVTKVASSWITDGIDNKFGRDQERQSDYLGVVWAVEAGYDPFGAASLHDQLSRHSSVFIIRFMTTHPGSKEREATLRGMAERLAAESIDTAEHEATESAIVGRLLAEADSGDVGAQYRLGIMYAEGDEVEIDDLKAFKWLTIAVGAGRRDAYEALSRVAGRMSGSETVEAVMLVQDWEKARQQP